MRTLPLLSSLLLLPLLGCPPQEKTDSDTASAESDTDTDADSDTDTDSDTDADRTDYNFTGSVTVQSTAAGATVCDAAADLTGTPYTGDCEGCDFAIDMSATVTTDNSTADCTYYPTASFIEGGGYSDLIMAHADEYYVYYAGYQNDVFFSGYSYASYTGPYFYGVIAYDGGYYGSFTRTGDDIAWSFTGSGTSTYLYAYDGCGDYAEYSYSAGPFTGDGGSSTLACDGSTTDVWEFTSDGSAVSISVDTNSADTAFDPRMWVNGPDSCTTDYADDNFDCTYPPPSYMCPSIETAGTAGVYQVVVTSYGSCAGSEAGYTLAVEGGTNVTLVVDDAVSGYDYTFDVEGSGTLSE
jgi:hypothetical protein